MKVANVLFVFRHSLNLNQAKNTTANAIMNYSKGKAGTYFSSSSLIETAFLNRFYLKLSNFLTTSKWNNL